MEADHFHPTNGTHGFLTKLTALNTALAQNDTEAKTWVSGIKAAFPKDGTQTWKWHHILNGDDEKGYSISRYFQSLIYNDINNLWLIDGDANGSMQDKVKLPENGTKAASSILGQNQWYGNDFLAKFGTILADGTFQDTHLDRSGLVIYATVTFDDKCNVVTLKANERMGLATLARLWFSYRYKTANSFGKQIGIAKAALQDFMARAIAELEAIEGNTDASDTDRGANLKALLQGLPTQLKQSVAHL